MMADTIKKWEDRQREHFATGTTAKREDQFKDDEIAELRAALDLRAAVAVPQDDDLAVLLTTFDMGLGFALCHRDFGDTRGAIKRLQQDFTAIRAALAQRAGSSGDGKLPPLPKHFGMIDVYGEDGSVKSVEGWTADQVRAYVIYARAHGYQDCFAALATRQPAPMDASVVECEKCEGQGATHYPDGEWEGKCVSCKGTGIQRSADVAPVGVGETGETTTDYSAKRLRLIAEKLGLGTAIPEKNADLWACAFSVLGMIRAKVDELTAQDCSPCESMGFVDGTGEACQACNGSGQQPDSGRDAALADPLPQGWSAAHPEPWDALTDKARMEQRINVSRLEAPFCDSVGRRCWSGPTLAEALETARKALGIDIATQQGEKATVA